MTDETSESPDGGKPTPQQFTLRPDLSDMKWRNHVIGQEEKMQRLADVVDKEGVKLEAYRAWDELERMPGGSSFLSESRIARKISDLTDQISQDSPERNELLEQLRLSQKDLQSTKERRMAEMQKSFDAKT